MCQSEAFLLSFYDASIILRLGMTVRTLIEHTNIIYLLLHVYDTSHHAEPVAFTKANQTFPCDLSPFASFRFSRRKEWPWINRSGEA